MAHVFFNSTQKSLREVDDNDVPTTHEKKFVPRAQWLGNGPDGIRAWASDIPSGAAAGAPSPNDPIYPLSSSPPVPALRPPKLLLPHKRPVPPTLCMTTPTTASPLPSLPILKHVVSLSSSGSGDSSSVGRISLPSAVTESLVATPSSAKIAKPMPCLPKSNVFSTFASQVRSWVAGASPQSQVERPKSSLRTKRLPTTPPPYETALDSATFTIIATSNRSPPLGSDTSSDDGAWWAPTIGVVNAKLPTSKKGLPRGRRIVLEQSIPTRHQVFNSRGRQLSRAAA
jgi:hypothetical protein